MKVYRIRDKNTGKFIQPNKSGKPYWSEKHFAKAAIACSYRCLSHDNWEIVEFDCVEVAVHEI